MLLTDDVTVRVEDLVSEPVAVLLPLRVEAPDAEPVAVALPVATDEEV